MKLATSLLATSLLVATCATAVPTPPSKYTPEEGLSGEEEFAPLLSDQEQRRPQQTRKQQNVQQQNVQQQYVQNQYVRKQQYPQYPQYPQQQSRQYAPQQAPQQYAPQQYAPAPAMPQQYVPVAVPYAPPPPPPPGRAGGDYGYDSARYRDSGYYSRSGCDANTCLVGGALGCCLALALI